MGSVSRSGVRSRARGPVESPAMASATTYPDDEGAQDAAGNGASEQPAGADTPPPDAPPPDAPPPGAPPPAAPPPDTPPTGAFRKRALLVSALLAYTWVLVGTYTLYVNNPVEYRLGFRTVLPHLSVVAAGLAATLTLVAWLLPRVLRARLVTLLFSLALVSWCQATFLLGQYGLVHGGRLEFEANAWRRPQEAVLWIGALLLAQALHARIAPRLVYLSLVFLVVQTLPLPFIGKATAELEGPYGQEMPFEPDPELSSLSRTSNVIVIVSDTITIDTFRALLDEDPERYESAFDGFTLFTDTLGAYPTTRYALPVMLGAPPYRNQEPELVYERRALREETITGPLLEAGYAVDWLALQPVYCQYGASSSCFALPMPYASGEVYRRQMAALLLDVSLFRHAPHDLKQQIYNDGRWRVLDAVARDERPLSFAGASAAFWRTLLDGMRVDREQPCLKILHVGGGHAPAELTADCSLLPGHAPYTQETYVEQVRCSLGQTVDFMQRLRDLGVYDDALIVFASDHGAIFPSSDAVHADGRGSTTVPAPAGDGSAGSPGSAPLLDDKSLSLARPVLAVKWPGSAPGLRRSAAPASLYDIGPTIAASTGLPAPSGSALPGRDLARLDENEARTRHYGVYVLGSRSDDYLERIERYRVDGPILSPDAWTRAGVLFPPGTRLAHRSLDLGTRTARKHLSYHGWGADGPRPDGTTLVRSVGPRSTIYLSLPRNTPIQLVARVRAHPRNVPQAIDIEVDGTPVGVWTIESGRYEVHTVVVPPEAVRKQISEVTLAGRKWFRPANTQGANYFELDWVRVETP